MECLADRRYQFWWFANRQRSKVISKLGRVMQPKLLRCHKEGLLEPFIGHSDHFGWITISINHPIESILAQNDYQEQLMRSNGPISNVRPRIAWQTLHAWSQFCRGFDTLHSNSFKLRVEAEFLVKGVSTSKCFSQHFIANPWDAMPSTFRQISRKLKGWTRSFVFVGRLFRISGIVCIFFYWASFYLILPVHLETPWRFFLVKQSLR